MKYIYILAIVLLASCSGAKESIKENTLVNHRAITRPEMMFSDSLIYLDSGIIPDTLINEQKQGQALIISKRHIRVRGKIDTTLKRIYLDITVPEDTIKVADTIRTEVRTVTEETTNYKATIYIIILLLILVLSTVYFIKR